MLKRKVIKGSKENSEALVWEAKDAAEIEDNSKK